MGRRADVCVCELVTDRRMDAMSGGWVLMDRQTGGWVCVWI